MQGVLDASVTELAASLRAGRLSPLDLIDAHIARATALNPTLCAVVGQRFDAARQEALAAEARLLSAPRGAPLPPLLGVPFTAQEAVGVAGQPETGGSVYRWDAVSTRDSTAIARLRAAGAIPMAVTNVPEGGLWLETNNLVYGRTNNPWNSQHTAGGACGGEAALIAAGGSPFGIGSGLLSAAVVPAAFCGVAAYQPTAALAPRATGWPAAHLGCGLLARRCADLHLLGPVLTGQPPAAPPPDDLAGRTVYVLDGFPGVRIAAPVAEALGRAAAALEERGARLAPLSLPGLEAAQAIWGAMLAERLPQEISALLGDGQSVPVLREALRFPLGRANHTSSALILAVLETIRRTLPQRGGDLLADGAALRHTLEEALGRDGVLLHPPYSRPAPRHRGTLVTPFDGLLSGLFAVMGMPSAVAPIGFDVSGLPLAAQLTAARGRDTLPMDAAAHLEAAFGGWVRAQPQAVG